MILAICMTSPVPVTAAKRDAASAGTTSSLNKAQSEPPPIVIEGVDDVCLMMQSIENIVDIEKVKARASMGGVLGFTGLTLTHFAS